MNVVDMNLIKNLDKRPTIKDHGTTRMRNASHKAMCHNNADNIFTIYFNEQLEDVEVLCKGNIIAKAPKLNYHEMDTSRKTGNPTFYANSDKSTNTSVA